ncbi:hypothetical protein LCGC14_1393670, partial [marine sediment metagenome]
MRIDLGESFRKEKGREATWKKLRRYYRNEFPNMANIIPVNITFGIGRAMLPQVYFRTPSVSIRARKEQFQQNVPLIEAVDNFLLKKLRVKEQMKLILTDVYTDGIGLLKFGYDSLYHGVVPEEQDQLSFFESQMTGTPLEGAIKELRKDDDTLEYHDLVSEEMPWALRWDPMSFVVEPGVRDLDSAQWCAFYSLRPLEDVLKDSAYTNTKDLEGTRVHRGTDQREYFSRRRDERDPQIELVELYEIYDKREKRMMVYAKDHDKFLRNEPWDIPMEGFPCEILHFNKTGDDFYPVSDAQYILTQQDELNDLRTHEAEHRRTASLKGAYDVSKIDEEGKERLASGEVLPLIGVDGDPHTAVAFFRPEMSRDLFAVDEIIQSDVRQMLGFSRNQEGEFDVDRRTATEARIVQQMSELRTDERRDMLADFLGRTVEKLNQLIFHFWNSPRAIQLGGGEGDWTTFTGTEIKGEYQIEVIPDSLLPLSRKIEKAEARELAQTMLQMPIVQASMSAQMEVVKILAKAHREILDEERFIADIQLSLQQMQQEVGGAPADNGAAGGA